MKHISSSIANQLGEYGILQEEDIDKCRYGLEIFISSVLEVFSIMMLSIFSKNFVETLLFFGALIPLRIYAGGYHADTKLRCYIISLVVYGIFSLLLKTVSNNVYMTFNIAELLFTLTAVCVAAPVVHHRRNVNDIEIQNYKKISITICAIQSVIILICSFIFKKNIFVFSFALGQLSVALSMAAAMIKSSFNVGNDFAKE